MRPSGPAAYPRRARCSSEDEHSPSEALLLFGIVTTFAKGSAHASSPGLQALTTLQGLRILLISCGSQHCAVVAETGLHTWGRGTFGRLGHGNTDAGETPRLVQDLAGVPLASVACGFAHTVVATADGDLYTWGNAENGRLGNGQTHGNTLSPTKVTVMARAKVTFVCAGSMQTCALTASGEVYSCGGCEYNGHGGDRDVLVPTILDGFDRQCVVQISLSPGGYHTIALAAGGDVYTWGQNRVGQLGYATVDATDAQSDAAGSHGFRRNAAGAAYLPCPRVVESLRCERIKQVEAGWGHSAVVTWEGAVLVCGRNVKGQLGLGPPNAFPVNERGHSHVCRFTPIAALVRVLTRARLFFLRARGAAERDLAAAAAVPRCACSSADKPIRARAVACRPGSVPRTSRAGGSTPRCSWRGARKCTRSARIATGSSGTSTPTPIPTAPTPAPPPPLLVVRNPRPV